jgi:glycosyltransferase involved in cell wall biosynthesis
MGRSLPIVTVYITNYNYGKYISQSIDSVLNQTYENIELIIIDDGSTDNSKEIINEYEEEKGISIIYQNNKGLTVSNNIAISVARGEYIMRLDADDYLDPNAVSLLYAEFEKDDKLGMAFGDWYEIDEFDNVTSIERRHDFNTNVSLLDQPAHGACTMFKLEYLKQLQGYDETLTRQDGYELWFRFVKKYKIRSINIPIFYYRKHGDNLTSDETKLLNARAQILEKHSGRNIENKNILSIIPVRGSEIDIRSQPFLKIGRKSLIDYTVEELLLTKSIRHILVTTPDTSVIKYIKDIYSDPRILTLYRDPKMARINTNLSFTLMHALKNYEHLDEIDSFFISTIETPFKRKELLDSAINVKNIFKVDTVVGVTSEKNLLFKHDGHGLVPISKSSSMLRLEREQLHNYVTGYTLCDVGKFLKTGVIFEGTIGHISIDQKAATTIRSKLDVKIAEILSDEL